MRLPVFVLASFLAFAAVAQDAPAHLKPVTPPPAVSSDQPTSRTPAAAGIIVQGGLSADCVDTPSSSNAPETRPNATGVRGIIVQGGLEATGTGPVGDPSTPVHSSRPVHTPATARSTARLRVRARPESTCMPRAR